MQIRRNIQNIFRSCLQSAVSFVFIDSVRGIYIANQLIIGTVWQAFAFGKSTNLSAYWQRTVGCTTFRNYENNENFQLVYN